METWGVECANTPAGERLMPGKDPAPSLLPAGISHIPAPKPPRRASSQHPPTPAFDTASRITEKPPTLPTAAAGHGSAGSDQLCSWDGHHLYRNRRKLLREIQDPTVHVQEPRQGPKMMPSALGESSASDCL